MIAILSSAGGMSGAQAVLFEKFLKRPTYNGVLRQIIEKNEVGKHVDGNFEYAPDLRPASVNFSCRLKEWNKNLILELETERNGEKYVNLYYVVQDELGNFSKLVYEIFDADIHKAIRNASNIEDSKTVTGTVELTKGSYKTTKWKAL